MKRRELLKLFTNAGWYFLRNGANHDIYTNGKDNVPIPRHPDINEVLARALIITTRLTGGFTKGYKPLSPASV